MGCVLLTSLSCNAFRQPYTPPIPIDQIPRIEVPFGDTGKTIKDELAGGSKLYVVRVHENEDLQLDLRPQDSSIRFTVIDMQTGKGIAGEEGTWGLASHVPSTGDYLITVYGKPQPFTLTCRIK